MDGSEGKQTPQGWNRTHTLDALEFPLLQLHCCLETCREAGISHLKAMGALGPELRKMQEGMWSGGWAGVSWQNCKCRWCPHPRSESTNCKI